MCGRFTLSTPADQLAEHFGFGPPPPLKPRYNVAPTQTVPVVGLKPDGATRGLLPVRWGLVPADSNGPKGGPLLHNARAETVDRLPSFRDCFRRKRCLVPADGFYEWQTVGKKKHPHHFRLRDRSPFAFAGLWDVWGEGRERVISACFLTVTPNELVAPLHDRMPLILPRDQYARWLSHDTPVAELLTLLKPYPAGEMEAVRVGPAVGKVANDGPECLEPAADERPVPASLFG